mmetsp:Transcript_29237/g.58393  ORF Transcript_29237/g.58393 Transcript_29237/m.58393 type:complete len:399 (-) Transcript_29237:834-2030(-)
MTIPAAIPADRGALSFGETRGLLRQPSGDLSADIPLVRPSNDPLPNNNNNNDDNDDDNDDDNNNDNNNAISTTTHNLTHVHPETVEMSPPMSLPISPQPNNKNNNNNNNVDAGAIVPIVIVDAAGKRFPMMVDPSWTVLDFQHRSAAVHSVPPAGQRLVHLGRMISSSPSQPLSSFNIKAGEGETTIHLFPKPVVVRSDAPPPVTSSSGSVGPGSGGGPGLATTTTTTTTAGAAGADNAHVPRIVVSDEAAALQLHRAMNGSTSPLYTTAGAYENVRRVKVLSALLILICLMQLLTLFTVVAGVQSEVNPDRDAGGGGGGKGGGGGGGGPPPPPPPPPPLSPPPPPRVPVRVHLALHPRHHGEEGQQLHEAYEYKQGAEHLHPPNVLVRARRRVEGGG